MQVHHPVHAERPRKLKPHANGSKRSRTAKLSVLKGAEVFLTGLSGIFSQLGFGLDDIVIFLWQQGNKKINLAYTPSEYRAGPGQTVHWVSLFGHFSITALGPSAFQRVCYRSYLSPTGYRVDATVRDVPPGTYRYAVALTTGGDKIYVDPSCPPIIVE